MNLLDLLGILVIATVYGRPGISDTELPETTADFFFTALSARRAEVPWEVGAPWEEFKVELEGKLATLEKRLANHQNSLDSLKAGITSLTEKVSPLSSILAKLGRKSKTPVYFSAYRTSEYRKLKTTLTYDQTWVNVGGAMNVNTGIFKAPYHGIYYFYFNAHIQYGTVALQVNDEGRAAAGHVFHETSSSGLSQMLELKRGDRVSVFIMSHYMYDATKNPHYKGPYYGTQFTGMLLHNLE